MTAPATATEAEAWESKVEAPDISDVIIEDDEPLDNIYSEKQQRLLTQPLYTSWSGPPPDEDGRERSFVATANVGVFASPHEPPLVPDVLLSADVRIHPDFRREKRHNTYFVWEMGKPPDVVIEVVSNREGGELGKRKHGYARMRVAYYVVWDPERWLRGPELLAFELKGSDYVPLASPKFPPLGLELAPWEGRFEDVEERWLRWYQDGVPIPTGAERAQAAEERAERLAALLAAHGISPDGEEA